MVRETRYLLVGNLPETITEDEITEYFKRFGKIQKVKLERKPEVSDQEEKEEGCVMGLTATVAFTDIKSASTACKAEKTINNNVLTSEYSSGFGATGNVVQRTHEPEIYPHAPIVGQFPNRKGCDEEADGFDVYYGTMPQYSEPCYVSPTLSDRGRPTDRHPPPGAPFPNRAGKWIAGTTRSFTESSNKDGFEKPKTTSAIPPSPTTSQTSSKHRRKKKKFLEQSGSQSSSNSSRSSSSCSDAGSASSKERPKITVAAKSEVSDVVANKESDIEPGEREPLGIHITKLPLRSSDTSLRDGLFHEYKKYGKITAVQITGVAETRFAIISFKQSEDAAKALEASKDKRFFGTAIHVVQHDGLEVEDCAASGGGSGGGEFLTPEAQLDEHSPKATRTLFLGNLDKEITIEEIKEKLEKYGEILDVDVKRQGAVTAYSFIQFTDITSVVKALKDLDGVSWGATKLKVGFGKSMATPVVWLGNLADSVHEGFLCRQFVRFGMLSHAIVDKETHKGLVFFMTVESAQYALPEMRNRVWNGKKIHIDYASRDCQEAFLKKMEQSGQLHSGEKPDARWMEKRLASLPPWDDGMDTNFKRGGFNQFARGRGCFQRGRSYFRGHGGSYEGTYAPGSEDFGVTRRKQFDELSQGSGPFMEGESYEQELRDYGHSQRERCEQTSPPPSYQDVYFDHGSQSGQEYKNRFGSYRNASPGSDRDMDVSEEEFKYKTHVTRNERYYNNKDKLYEEDIPRDGSHSSDSEHYKVPSEVVSRQSRRGSPTRRQKGTKELPISYQSPTPADDGPCYPSDNSPTDFESIYRKYEAYTKGINSDGDKKSSVLNSSGLRKEIDSKTEERPSRKRSYDQISPKHSDSILKLERRLSKSESWYEFDNGEKLTAMELISKVVRLRSDINKRLGRDSPLGSNGDLDPATISDADLIKLHREKQKLFQQLTVMDDAGNNSDDNGDAKISGGKKPRLDLKHIQKSESFSKQELKEKLKMLDETSSNHEQMECLHKKELCDLQRTKSGSMMKNDYIDYSEDDNYSLNSSHGHSPGFISKKRRKVEGESIKIGRLSHVKLEDGQQAYNSEEEKTKADLLQRQNSMHVDLYSSTSLTTSMSSLDARLENDLFSVPTKDDSCRISSGSDTYREQSKHGNNRKGRHKHKKENHITPLIPLGNDDMPDPETYDPRVKSELFQCPLVLPLPEFAQFIQFSPLSSPHQSPEHYSCDLLHDSSKESVCQVAPVACSAKQPYQSPCFSPQSSSSKTHSPSQSPYGSNSDMKLNANSDCVSGDVAIEFPTEAEQVDPEKSKANGLGSVIGQMTLLQDSKDEDSFSDNNSDTDHLCSENLSIDERIRQLDEKWNKAQAVTPKIILDVDNVVNSATSSSMVTSLIMTTSIVSSVSSPVSSLYSKYRIRRKGDTCSGSEKLEPSEIVQTFLSKSSIFDQDSKRLGQINDSNIELKDTSSANDSSPKSYSAWSKLGSKDNSLLTVPGSLLDRLGQGSNGSFPTLTVNTVFPCLPNLSISKTDTLGIENRVSILSSSPCLESSENLHSTPNFGFIEKLPVGMGYGNGNTGVTSVAGTNISVFKLNAAVSETGIEDTLEEMNIPVLDSSVDHKNIQMQLLIKSENNNTTKSVCKSESPFKLDNIKADIFCKGNNSCKMDTSEFSNKFDESKMFQTVIDSASVEKIKTDKNCLEKSPLEVSINYNIIGGKEITSLKTDNTIITDKTSQCHTTTKQLSSGERIITNNADAECIVQKEKSIQADAERKTEMVSLKEDFKKNASVDNPKEHDKCSGKNIFTTESNDSLNEPINKRPKLSRVTGKRSSSSHNVDKHKMKNDSKSDLSSIHGLSSDKSEEKKDKHKGQCKDKKDFDKNSKDIKKDNRDEKKKLLEKKDNLEKDGKEKSEKKENKCDKNEDKKEKESGKHDKDKPENNGKKDKGIDKNYKEKTDKKDKVVKKQSHKNEKHGLKSPDKRPKSSLNGENEPTVDKNDFISKDYNSIINVVKDINEKIKSDQGKSNNKIRDHANKEEHKSYKGSSHKVKKTKTGSSFKKSKHGEDNENILSKDKNVEFTRKSKDDHSEHKRKEEAKNRNNKNSPDKSKEFNQKETCTEKKSLDKSSFADKCKEERTKYREKENKDKYPDIPKTKSQSSIPLDSGKPLAQTTDTKIEKTSAEAENKDTKLNLKREDKKNKDVKTAKSSNLILNAISKETDSLLKCSIKNQKSNKAISNDQKNDLNKSKEAESRAKKDNQRRKGQPVYNGLTEEDLAIFAQFSEEPYMSMYDKVKRRSTEKKLHCEKEQEEQKKLFTEYKHKSKWLILSDITESSEISSDEERKKTNETSKFELSNDSESSVDSAILNKKSKSKTQTKRPKKILDVYSSDSEEEELYMKTPAKKSTYKKKNAEVYGENENKFELDSISESDNQTSATKHAKSKYSTTTKQSQSKGSADIFKSKNEKSDKRFKPKIHKNISSFQNLFSDESDESMHSLSDSNSDIVVPSKTKKELCFNKTEKKNKLPMGRSIYTSSDESESNVFQPVLPTKITLLPDKSENKEMSLNDQINKDCRREFFLPDIVSTHKYESKKINHKIRNIDQNTENCISDLEIKHVKEKIKHTFPLEMVKDKIPKTFDIVDKTKNDTKFNDIIRSGEQVFQASPKIEKSGKLYSGTAYEKALLSNLTNNDTLPSVLTGNRKDFKLHDELINNDKPTLKDLNFDSKFAKAKNRKNKKENKNKQNNKDRTGKYSAKEENDTTKFTENDNPDYVQQDIEFCKIPILNSNSENACLNDVNRNLFEELKVTKSPRHGKENNKKEKNYDKLVQAQTELEEKKLEPENVSNSDILSDLVKIQVFPQVSNKVNENTDMTKHVGTDVFDFMDDENGMKPIKESHLKLIKSNIQNEEDKPDIAIVHIEDQGIEIEYKSEEQDYSNEGNCLFPLVETTEIVIAASIEEKIQSEKPKLKDLKDKRHISSVVDCNESQTQEAISRLKKEDKQPEGIHFEVSVSNEQELVIDEGVSLHVDTDSGKTDEAIVNDENDETAKAVESLLLDEIAVYSISEPVEPTPQLDQNYLQPVFAPSLPRTFPCTDTEAEDTTFIPFKGKKGCKRSRTKSDQNSLTNENSSKFDRFDSSCNDITSQSDQNDDDDDDDYDDDDDGRLQIDFDPPKPETKQKRQRKPRQHKENAMNGAVNSTAEDRLDNLFGTFNETVTGNKEHNLDCLSGENSELERSKQEDMLFMDREDQRHDSDIMSPDEKSTSDDLLSSSDVTKVKARRGRKPKCKDLCSALLPRTNSPRSIKTLSTRSPRNFDPRSPKTEVESKLNGPKELLIEEGVYSKPVKLESNIYDFDEKDESSSNVRQITSAGKQRNSRGKKIYSLQSPEKESVFSSPEHKSDTRLMLGSPDSKNSCNQVHNVADISGKNVLFSPTLSLEELKVEVNSVLDEKPPEPLFKAFFEAKSKNDNDKIIPLFARKTGNTPKEYETQTVPSSQSLSNVDKTIENVSKGLFENSDEQLDNNSFEQFTAQKEHPSKKNKDDDFKSLIKSPNVKSPVVNQHTSPLLTVHQQPLFLPGMGNGQPLGQTQIGEPQLAGHVGKLVHLSLPVSTSNKTPSSVDVKLFQENVLNNSPPAGKLIEQQPSLKTTIVKPDMKSPVIITAQTTITTSCVSSASAAPDVRKVDSIADELKINGIQGIVQGISAVCMNSVQELASTMNTGQVAIALASVTDVSNKHQVGNRQILDKQLLDKPKFVDQKLSEIQLQKQQEHHVMLKEQELKKQQHLEHQKQLEQQHRKLQEQLKLKEEMLKKEQRLQLQRQQNLKFANGSVVSVSPGVQSGQLLSPGALQRAKPNLPSPVNGKSAPRAPLSVHHQFGLVSQHSGTLQVHQSHLPSLLANAQLTSMHVVQPLVSDKTPTDAEVVLKHQQLQQQIAAQQAQAQAFAEQQAQLNKQQTQTMQFKLSAAIKGNVPIGKVTSLGCKKITELQSKDAPLPGSLEAANQLTKQIKQQLALQQAQQQGHQRTQQPQTPHLNWSLLNRPDGSRQPSQIPLTTENKTSMSGPVQILGGSSQQVQRVSPHPPTKSPTVAQTAPNMTHGFSQHQAAASRVLSPPSAKTAEQCSSNTKWPGSNQPRQGQLEPRPRVTSADNVPPSSRPEHWTMLNGPTCQTSLSLNPTPRPAHQQPPSAHQQQPEHALQLTRPPSPANKVNKDNLFQQQQKYQADLQRPELIRNQHQELHRQQQRELVQQEQAQKEVHMLNEQELAEREKCEREAHGGFVVQSVSDTRQSPAIRLGYPFVEPSPPSREGKTAIVDPRFSQQYPGHHPADLRISSSQAGAFSPAARKGQDTAHMYTPVELQHLQHNGCIQGYPPGLLMCEPHLISGHGPYIIPGGVPQHIAYMAQQKEHPHLTNGRPPSHGTSRPPSNQPTIHTVSPTQPTPSDVCSQNLLQSQTIGPPIREQQFANLLSWLKRYPVMWEGVLGLKNDHCVVQMHFISGFQPLVEMSLPQQAPDGTVQPLRIAQRMRLEQAQLEGVSKRMQMEKDYCMMLALPCGRDKADICQQTHAMSTGFIQYLQQKQAAGIVNVADPGSQQPAYVVHIFPPCDFSQNTLCRLGFDLLYQVKDLAYLVVIIATVA